MAIWLVRAGSAGQYEAKFLGDSKIYLTWNDLDIDLGSFPSKEACREAIGAWLGSPTKSKLSNTLGQLWGFAHGIQVGDLIALPSKVSPTIHFGVVKGPYRYDPSIPSPFGHARDVQWTHLDVPRAQFPQDILYSMGAFMTVCRIERNDAEKRISRVLAGGALAVVPDEEIGIDLESLAREQIAVAIGQKFKGYALQEVVAGILRAMGYQVLVSPPGADKGVDLLAATGPLGFSEPRLCIQVKSGDATADTDTLFKLIGSMKHTGASHGLLVSWGGFKQSVLGDLERKEFFNVRLWSQDELVRQILQYYDQLPAEIRAELPLKRTWLLAHAE
jgi:restriction system protein